MCFLRPWLLMGEFRLRNSRTKKADKDHGRKDGTGILNKTVRYRQAGDTGNKEKTALTPLTMNVRSGWRYQAVAARAFANSVGTEPMTRPGSVLALSLALIVA